MKVKKIEHLGIAVKETEKAIQIFNKLLESEPYKTEQVNSEQVNTIFYRVGDQKIELLEAISAESPISKFLEKRGEGMHHIALEVDDIRSAMEELKQKGFRILNDEPKCGADNKEICFLHPKDTAGVLIELCEDIKS